MSGEARRVLAVTDGDRDHHAAVALASTGAGVALTAARTVGWARLHGGRGYERKLKYAIRQARSGDLDGVVAVVDRDRAGRQDRIGALASARDQDRELGPPVAVGQADPTFEAWLVDDVEPLRAVCGLDATASAPDPRSPRVKQELQAIAPDGAVWPELYAAIAQQVSPSRCRRGAETGLRAFFEDARSAFG